MDKICSGNDIRAVKLVRATMEEIRHFLEKNQKCINQIKVIHLLRDPRGRLNSLHECCKFNLSNINMISNMCDREMKDVQMVKQLEELYPGTLVELKYEDLAADTLKVSKNLYNFLWGTNPPLEIENWIKRNRTKASEKQGNTERRDPKSTSLAWMKKITLETYMLVKKRCQTLLNYLLPK